MNVVTIMHMFVLLRLLVFNKRSHVLFVDIVLSELTIPRGAINYTQSVSSLIFLLNSFLLNIVITTLGIPPKWESTVAHSGDSIHVNCLLFPNRLYLRLRK